MEQNFDISVYISLLRRRFFHMVIPASLIFTIVCVVAYRLPAVYESTATILVESQQIPSDLARSTVTSGAAERIRIIEQRLMTRENLLEIARKFNLYSSKGRETSPTEIVSLMRQATSIRQLGTGGRRGQGRAIAFTVSFSYGNAGVAARVANEFSTRILEQNIQTRTDRASQTRGFFARLVVQLEKKMADLSTRIIEFKRENKDTLPETLELRRAQLIRMQDERAAVMQKVAELEGQLQQLRQNRLGNTADGSVAERLNILQNELVQLRVFYSDSHPSVKKVLLQITALENMSRPLPRSKPEQGDSADLATGAIENSDNPRFAPQAALIETQLEKLGERRSLLDARIGQLEETIAETPETGLELGALTRQLKNLQVEYRGVITKRVDAETGERLEEDRQAERFEIIDRATPAAVPVKPDRKKIVLAGFFGSGAVGVGLVVLLEILNNSVRSGADVARQLQIRPIVSIPYIETEAERRMKYRRWSIFFLLAVSSPLVILTLVHFYYQRLDILFYSLLRKAGL